MSKKRGKGLYMKRGLYNIIGCFLAFAIIFSLPVVSSKADDVQDQSYSEEDEDAKGYISVCMNPDGSKTEEWVTFGENGTNYIHVIEYDKDGNRVADLYGSEGTDAEGTKIIQYEGSDIENNEIHKSEKVYASKIREYQTYIYYANGTQVVTNDVRYPDGSTLLVEDYMESGGDEVITIEKTDTDKKLSKEQYRFVKKEVEIESEWGNWTETETVGLSLMGLQPKTKLITIPDSITTYWKSTYDIVSIDDKAFCNNKKVKTVKIGKNVVEIGADAFKNDKKLKTIKIYSDKITKVGDGAFEGIAKNAVIYVKSGKRYKEIVALIKASGVGDGVKFKKLK